MKGLASNHVILMDPFPALGHINAFLNLARWLRNKGLDIVFIGSSEHQQIYLNEGFRFYELYPLIFMSEAFEIKEKGHFRFFLDNVYKSRDSRFLEYFHMVSTTYRRIIEVIKPDLVLLDNHYALKAFFYKDLKLDVVIVSTMISPFKGTITPPFQSDYVPKHTQMSRIYINLLWLKNRMNRTFRNWISGLTCLGKTDITIIRKFFNSIPYTLDTYRCHGIGILQVPMIATYPSAFDFEVNRLNKSVSFFGHLQKVAMGELDDARLEALLSHRSEKKIIYCSLGTITFDHLKPCHNFFERIIKVAVKNPQWHFLLNVGKHYDINKLSSPPENISVFFQVPQRQLLNRVHIMINHGGINSIKECLRAHVPMIVYPLSRKWDQPGCAARVAYHRLGVIGDIRKDNSTAINAKINFLVEHLEEYKNNIRHLNDEIKKRNRSENKRILTLIKHYVNKSRQPNPLLHETSKEPVKEIPCPTNG